MSEIKSLKEIASVMGLSPQSAKKWIQTFTDITFHSNKKRKRYFTPGEVERIIKEWES